MSQEEVFEFLKDLAKEMGIEDLTLDTVIFERMDSLDYLDLNFEIENKYNVSINEGLPKSATIQDIIDFILK
jgi:acyl carrier protein